MIDESARQELRRQIAAQLRNGGGTGFDMTVIERVLAEAEGAPVSEFWTAQTWEEFAEAMERVTQTAVKSDRVENGALLTVQEDGQPLSEQYRQDTQCILKHGTTVIEEVERLRTVVEATGLVLQAEERDVMALLVAGLEVLNVFDCGDDPSQGLEDVCPICRLREALRRIGQHKRGSS